MYGIRLPRTMFLINSSGTPFRKAQDAPALLKVWNVKDEDIWRIFNTDFKCFLDISVKGT